MKSSVLCIGEVLWDVFPNAKYLGGAPLNVAYHLHSLGCDSVIASRIGNDELGHEARLRIQGLGLGDELLQSDPTLSTGRVNVTLVNADTPEYEIEAPSAWDSIETHPDLTRAAEQAQAIVFGTLAQRSERSRRTIRNLLHGDAMRVFDVNIRKPFVDIELIRMCLGRTDLLKINEAELHLLGGWFGFATNNPGTAADFLYRKFGCRMVCITRGSAGASLWQEGKWFEHPGYVVDAIDPVGAGDAFLAGLLNAILRGHQGAEALATACAVGAYVATQPSATPRLNHDAIRLLESTVISA